MEAFPSPAVLLFNFAPDQRLAGIETYLVAHGVRAMPVRVDRFHWPIGALLGLPGYESPQTKSLPAFSDEMLVMYGFDQAMLQDFLDFFSREKLPRVALKAMLTPYNAAWDASELHRHLRAEHEKLRKLKR